MQLVNMKYPHADKLWSCSALSYSELKYESAVRPRVRVCADCGQITSGQKYNVAYCCRVSFAN